MAPQKHGAGGAKATSQMRYTGIEGQQQCSCCLHCTAGRQVCGANSQCASGPWCPGPVLKCRAFLHDVWLCNLRMLPVTLRCQTCTFRANTGAQMCQVLTFLWGGCSCTGCSGAGGASQAAVCGASGEAATVRMSVGLQV